MFNEKEFYTFLKKLEKDNYFSLLSYGDGEWSFIFEYSGHEREIYSSEARKELLVALKLGLRPNCYLTSFSEKHADLADELLEKYQKNKELTDARLFYEALIDIYSKKGETPATEAIRELVDIVNEKHLIIIGEKELRKVPLQYDYFIETPSLGATNKIVNIEKEILEYGKPGLYAFSAGIASNILISRLHDKLPNSFLIDFGALWGLLYGIGTRKELKWDYPLI